VLPNIFQSSKYPQKLCFAVLTDTDVNDRTHADRMNHIICLFNHSRLKPRDCRTVRTFICFINSHILETVARRALPFRLYQELQGELNPGSKVTVKGTLSIIA